MEAEKYMQVRPYDAVSYFYFPESEGSVEVKIMSL